jgi:hypothetical protein
MTIPATRLTIEKMYQNEYWTNVYYLSTELGSSASAANAIVAAERYATLTPVLFTKYRLDDNTEDTDVYGTVPLNLFGLNTLGSGQMLALFNVLRVDFAAGVGRPSRKYYRGMLQEAVVNFNAIDSAVVADFQTNVAGVIAAVSAYVDVDGDDITNGTVYPFVGMRQLRRGSKKTVTP